MNVVYYAHSYRKEDAEIVSHFARLMRSEGLVPSLDPPSESVNAAKLERHLNSSDGMIAALTRRQGGVSPHILFEIALCLSARKPLIVFVEDTLPDGIIPARALQRRFSRRSFFRQVREHRHGLQILKAYLGQEPPPRYQPPTRQRSCLLIGVEDFGTGGESVMRLVESRGYNPVSLIRAQHRSLSDAATSEAIASADLALCFVDSRTPESHYLMGAARAAAVPSITFTANQAYQFMHEIPNEYQPRILPSHEPGSIQQLLGTEFELYEEDFVELDDQNEVETYYSMLMDLASPKGVYEPSIRNIFVEELVMRDQYKIGQAGAAGPGAHAHDMTFTQRWDQAARDIDLQVLARELEQLRAAMKQEAQTAEQDSAVGEVAAAEMAAKQRKGPEVLKHLASAGKWALDTAVKIGIGAASAALKSALGF